ncbi:MAG: hypothetical protein ACREF3_20905, partial [Acetobacteraceae bacterium]
MYRLVRILLALIAIPCRTREMRRPPRLLLPRLLLPRLFLPRLFLPRLLLSRLLLPLLLAVVLLHPPRSFAAAACGPAIAEAQQAGRLPTGLLNAVAMVESGRVDPRSGAVQPWPWTINVAGQG